MRGLILEETEFSFIVRKWRNNMKVILQERIANLGNVGDQVNVRPGYARNFLLPRNKAVQATPNNVVAFEKRRGDIDSRSQR